MIPTIYFSNLRDLGGEKALATKAYTSSFEKSNLDMHSKSAKKLVSMVCVPLSNLFYQLLNCVQFHIIKWLVFSSFISFKRFCYLAVVVV